ncbi:putative polymerase basic 1 [Rainbow trout orthomyxovirus-1]|uniref:RNA-directed RNA polymerase catalytic subunit n=1 Tax=Rainbow trout orthomyxovirus-1 TaxID=1954184 RepID=A0A1Q1MMC5_9ORTO|nr:putative polymerase basic 1 [Rainbow trout orthomyxovirus-1]AQM37674.1 putative polymerase basic 1 [Rainbow trout orthomyxovirus-1]
MELWVASVIAGREDKEEDIVNFSNNVSCTYMYDSVMKKHNTGVLIPAAASVHRSNKYSEGKTTKVEIKEYSRTYEVLLGNKITENEDPSDTSGVCDLQLFQHLSKEKIEQMGKENVRRVMEREMWHALNSPVEVLAQGRSAYCLITDTNLQSRMCLKNWLSATKSSALTIGDLINQHYGILRNHRQVGGKVWTFVYSEKHKAKVRKQVDVLLSWQEYSERSKVLLAFLKEAERTKSEPRAIFTASIPWRALIYCLEKVFEGVNKIDPVSVMAEGSDVKINSVNESFKTLAVESQSEEVVALTGDNSKFNECMSAEAAMAFIFECGLDNETENLLCLALAQFTEKRISVMRGIRRETEEHSCNIRAEDIELVMDTLSEEDQEILRGVQIDEKGRIVAPRGMLMGMANFCFTTIATVASSFSFSGSGVLTKQSSDDFVTCGLGETKAKAVQRIEMALKVSKAAGLNVSPKKSYICSGFTMEFNSMFIVEGVVLGNSGNMEYSTLAQALGPATDLYTGGKIGMNTMRRGGTNFHGFRRMCENTIESVEKLYYQNKKYKAMSEDLKRRVGDEWFFIPESIGGGRKPKYFEISQGECTFALKAAIRKKKYLAADWILKNSTMEADKKEDDEWEDDKVQLVSLRVDEGEIKRRKVKPKRKEDREFNERMQKYKGMYEEAVDANPILLIKGTAENLTLRDLREKGYIK